MPSIPSRLNHVTHPAEDPTSSESRKSLPVPNQRRPAPLVIVEPRQPALGNPAQRESTEAGNRGNIETTPKLFTQRRKVHTDPLDSLPRDLRPLFSDNPKPSEEEQRRSSPETIAHPETDGARDRGNETLSNPIQPEELHLEPQDDNPLEALDSTPKDPLPIMSTEAKPTENANITQPARKYPCSALNRGVDPGASITGANALRASSGNTSRHGQYGVAKIQLLQGSSA